MTMLFPNFPWTYSSMLIAIPTCIQTQETLIYRPIGTFDLNPGQTAAVNKLLGSLEPIALLLGPPGNMTPHIRIHVMCSYPYPYAHTQYCNWYDPRIFFELGSVAFLVPKIRTTSVLLFR
jgi:hypothetical protein